MPAKVNTFLVLLLGWSFVALGVIGLFLPLLQGVLFLLIGLFVLSSEYSWARRLLGKLRSRFPSLALRSDEAARRAHEALAQLFGRQSGTVRGRAPNESQAATHDPDSQVEPAGATGRCRAQEGRNTLHAAKVGDPGSSVAKESQYRVGRSQ
jgi:hypothetical protein